MGVWTGPHHTVSLSILLDSSSRLYNSDRSYDFCAFFRLMPTCMRYHVPKLQAAKTLIGLGGASLTGCLLHGSPPPCPTAQSKPPELSLQRSIVGKPWMYVFSRKPQFAPSVLFSVVPDRRESRWMQDDDPLATIGSSSCIFYVRRPCLMGLTQLLVIASLHCVFPCPVAEWLGTQVRVMLGRQ